MRHEQWRTQRLYRDRRQGRIMGVCAGLADYLGCDVTIIRVLAIGALIWFGSVTLIAYFALGFILSTQPGPLGGRGTDEPYRHSAGHPEDTAFGDVHHRVRGLDTRLQRMEGYVTSRRYDLDRQFRELED